MLWVRLHTGHFLDATSFQIQNKYLLFSCSTMSNSLQPRGWQHFGLLCPLPSPEVCSNLCPLSQWCCPTISSHVIPFPSCLQSFPASGSLPVSWFFTSGEEHFFSINPSNEYSELISFRIDWFDLPAVQGTLKSLLQHHSPKASILCHSVFFMIQLSHPLMTTRKTITLAIQIQNKSARLLLIV